MHFLHPFIWLSDCTTKGTRDIYIYSALCREYYACKRGFEAASLINCSNAKSMWAHKVSEIENHYLLIFFSMALLSGLLLITRRCTVMFNEYTCLRASTLHVYGFVSLNVCLLNCPIQVQCESIRKNVVKHYTFRVSK